MPRGRISSASVTAIKERASIVDIIQAFVHLKPSGHRFVGLCPFHQEKSPSFQVSADEGFFYCFGCQVGGDVITFVRMKLNMSFNEAMEHIAHQCGIPLEYEESEGPREQLEEHFRAMDLASLWFQDQLKHQPEVIDYLRKRGVTEETQKFLGLGFAPEAWSALTDHLSKHRIPQKVMESIGLAVLKKSGGVYSRFRSRVMIPVRDSRGRVIAFGGRWWGPERSDAAKYINSPETPLFHKSKVFFGAPFWEQTALQVRQIVIVEGYFDVIALWQKGLRHAVAVMGTGLTDEHVDWIRRKSLQLILVMDGDEAGRRASRRLLPILLKAGVMAKEFRLPQGEDPDTWAQKLDLQTIQKAFELAPSQFDSVVDEVLAKNQGTRDGEVEGAREIVQLLNHVEDPVQRSIYTKAVSERLGIELPTSGPGFSKRQSPLANSEPKARTAPAPKPQGSVPAHELLALLLHYPRFLSFDSIRKIVDDIEEKLIGEAVRSLQETWADQGFQSGDEEIEEREKQFLQLLRQKWQNQPEWLVFLARGRLGVLESEEKSRELVNSCVQRITDLKQRKQARELLYHMKSVEPHTQWEKLEELMKKKLEQARQRHGIKEENKVEI